MCLIGKTQLLCMQCRGIGPHLVARVKSHGFSRFATGTWGVFSSYGGLEFEYSCFFSKVSPPVYYDGYLRNLS